VNTLGDIILRISKLLAPFMPFLAEYIFTELKNTHLTNCPFDFAKELSVESIHLLTWSKTKKINQKLIEQMNIARDLASKGLEARAKAKINVRQPLHSLKTNIVSIQEIREDLRRVILDEVNVKSIIYEKALNEEVSLDTLITPDLKEEGIYREINRLIQDLRKETKLTVKDIVNLVVETDDMGKRIIEKYSKELKQNCSVREIVYENIPNVEEKNIQGLSLKIKIQ
jgi:isoleucyl-tRNA synthetase